MRPIPEVVSPDDGGPAVVRFHPFEPVYGAEESHRVRALREIRVRSAKTQERKDMKRRWDEEVAFPQGFTYSSEGDGWGGPSPSL